MFKRGFYGGKFYPFHKGHQYCIQFAAEQCEELFVLLFYHCEEEEKLIRQVNDKTLLDLLASARRIREVGEYCERIPNVKFVPLDCRVMHASAIRNGTNVWDSETEYVLGAVGDFQAVYSSEPGYEEYFKRAYPWAEHILIDVPREHVPISGTEIRNMSMVQCLRWL